MAPTSWHPDFFVRAGFKSINYKPQCNFLDKLFSLRSIDLKIKLYMLLKSFCMFLVSNSFLITSCFQCQFLNTYPRKKILQIRDSNPPPRAFDASSRVLWRIWDILCNLEENNLVWFLDSIVQIWHENYDANLIFLFQ